MYLRLNDEGFGFVVEGIHDIIDSDISISDDDYNKFMSLQEVGNQFRKKDVVLNPTGLFDYVEEFKTVCINPIEPTIEERLRGMEELLLTIL